MNNLQVESTNEEVNKQTFRPPIAHTREIQLTHGSNPASLIIIASLQEHGTGRDRQLDVF
jgi:hypothetical protein